MTANILSQTDILAADLVTPERVAAVRAELVDHVADGFPVAPIILDNPDWLLAMEDRGFIVELATGIVIALDATRPPVLLEL